MSRRGRKRKTGQREKNGRILRERGVDQNEIARAMPHRTGSVYFLETWRSIPADQLQSEKAENPLGRYNLVGAISDLQYNAGCRFRDDVLRYRRVLDIRKERQSIAGFGQPQAPTPREIDDGEAIKFMTEYMLAYEAMGSRAAQAAVKHVVMLEQEIDPAAFTFLDWGLEKLASHYGLTR